MSRLTITLDDAIHQSLKVTAVRQGRSIGKIIEESLLLRGIKPLEDACDLVAQARMNAQISEGDALAIGIAETKAVRS